MAPAAEIYQAIHFIRLIGHDLGRSFSSRVPKAVPGKGSHTTRAADCDNHVIGPIGRKGSARTGDEEIGTHAGHAPQWGRVCRYARIADNRLRDAGITRSAVLTAGS